MRYRNAQNIFPNDVLELIQQYADGEYIYIPRKAENHKHWGDDTHAKAEISERNQKIYAQYKTGQKVVDLALEFYLSEKSIQRIVTTEKKLESEL